MISRSKKEQFESDLERRRCRCCVSERQMRAAVWIVFGCALLAYTVYTVVQTVQSRRYPATTRQVLDVDEVASPGILLCPFDSPQTTAQPQVFVQSAYAPSEVCTLITSAGPGECRARFIEFAFRAVDPLPRVCLDIPPGIALRSTRDLVAIKYLVGQYLDADGRGGMFNGLYYGFYATDDDAARNATDINLANAGGKTVISFTATEYRPLSGPDRRGFVVGSVASAGLLSDGIVDVVDNSTGTPQPARVFTGVVYLATSTMTTVRTTEIWGFDWTQALGAIGGIYSLLKGWVITLQGQPKDPDGVLKRYFYAHDNGAAPAAAATAGGADLRQRTGTTAPASP